MEFRPIGKRILLKRIEKETKTQSGIYLPTTNQNEKPSIGTVISISDEVKNNYSYIKQNSNVAFKEYKANEITLENDEYLVIDIEDVLGIIE